MVKGGQLMLDGLMKFIPRNFVQRTDFKREISIVDQHIDGAEFVSGGPYHRLDLRFLRHIGLNHDAADTGAGYLIENFLGRGFILVIVDDDGCAALRQPDGSGCADAAACAGNERNFTGERARAKYIRHG